MGGNISIGKLCCYACGDHAICHMEECLICKQYVMYLLRLQCCSIAVVCFSCSFLKVRNSLENIIFNGVWRWLLSVCFFGGKIVSMVLFIVHVQNISNCKIYSTLQV